VEEVKMFKFKEADFWSIDYKALHKALVIYFKHHRKLSRLKNAIKNEGQVSWRRFVRGRLSFEDFKTFLYGMEAGGYFVIEELNEEVLKARPAKPFNSVGIFTSITCYRTLKPLFPEVIEDIELIDEKEGFISKFDVGVVLKDRVLVFKRYEKKYIDRKERFEELLRDFFAKKVELFFVITPSGLWHLRKEERNIPFYVLNTLYLRRFLERNYLGGRKNALGAEKKGFKFDT